MAEGKEKLLYHTTTSKGRKPLSLNRGKEKNTHPLDQKQFGCIET